MSVCLKSKATKGTHSTLKGQNGSHRRHCAQSSGNGQSSYPWLLHFLNGKLEQVGQLFNGQHRHGFALCLDALCYCNLLQVKNHTHTGLLGGHMTTNASVRLPLLLTHSQVNAIPSYTRSAAGTGTAISPGYQASTCWIRGQRFKTSIHMHCIRK